MNDFSNDVFSAPELYLLAAAFDGKVIFGLPEKEIYQLRRDDTFKDAHQRLKEKGILTGIGELTKGGSIVIQALEYYHQSKKYIRINNMMLAFRNGEEDELIALVEVDSEQYKLSILSKALILKGLSDSLPLILREPKEEEKNFSRKALLNSERHEVEQFKPDHLINIESFRLKDGTVEVNDGSSYEQWLAFEKNERLIMVNTVEKRYYHASQYWFLKILFDELEFPYKEAK